MMITRFAAKLDKFTLFIMICLVAIGTIAIYGATSDTKLDGLHISYLYLFGAFCVPLLLLAWLDYRILVGKLSYFFYAFGIGMLVLIKFTGEHINGAVRWLSIGGFQLQPSELVKIFTVMLIAHVLGKQEGRRLRLIQDIIPISIIFIIPILLIMQQPDLGTALVFIGALVSLLWMGNIRAIYLISLIGVIAVIIGTVLWLYTANFELLSKLVEPHQLSRIQAFLDPASDPDKSWHVKNAMYAIGSGGMIGSDAHFVRKGFIPYAYSDSIYVVIGEQFGFIGSALLLLLYFLLIYRMIQIAKASRDREGSYLVIGLMGMLVFQIFVNIGMHVGLVPLTGISLPFISYGGSSLLSNMVAIGLVLSVNVHKNDLY
ncbi:FtsW/RodA/SpoVE family cell cycle protein [Paenibacillus radicis (ex Gao et al. 2016)]|nr:FtsW/RodA/SpoVE family cell cycle protein [Paenibacillus radicis (ex Gao et al. 2016)]